MPPVFISKKEVDSRNHSIFDLFSGIGGFREGLRRAGNFVCVGHCEVDTYADKNYRLLFDTEGEWYCSDARTIEPERMPDFDLLCAGFPCQAFSIAGKREGFADARGTLFLKLPGFLKLKDPRILSLKMFPVCYRMTKAGRFAPSSVRFLNWGTMSNGKCLTARISESPSKKAGVYCRISWFQMCRKSITWTRNKWSSSCSNPGRKSGKRVYSPKGLSCTLTSQAGGMGGKTGLYDVGVPIKENTKLGYKLAREGDSIDLGYANLNSRRGRVGHRIAHTLTTGIQQEHFIL